jgi:hypothetical protein
MAEPKYLRLRGAATFCAITSVLIGICGLIGAVMIYFSMRDFLSEAAQSNAAATRSFAKIYSLSVFEMLPDFSVMLLIFGVINLFYIRVEKRRTS